jgi:hypothetical protein
MLCGALYFGGAKYRCTFKDGHLSCEYTFEEWASWTHM